MPARDDLLICVRREWDGWRAGFVRLADIQEVHWRQPAGAPRPLLHGYVRCPDIVAGDLPHECGETPTPHTLLVCALARHTAPEAYAELAKRADGSGDTRPGSPEGAAPLRVPATCDTWPLPAITTKPSRPAVRSRTLR